MRRPFAAAWLLLPLSLAAAGLVAQEPSAPNRTPPALRRSADQTYLTYPEWFLVFSPEAYADWVAERPPTDFPFLAHVRDVWAGYAAVSAEVPDETPTNWSYHAMIWVIAGSTTVEYAVRAVYETTIGRLSAATVTAPEPDGHLSAEDRFGAEIARDYERFLRQSAWYDFDYENALGRLWFDVPFTTGSPLRAIERRYALSSEFLFKLGYAQVLRAASHGTFDEASFVARTAAVLRGLPEDAAIEGLVVEERFEDGAVLVTLPRYEAFVPAARALAATGADFEEICGNRGRILVSLRAPTGTPAPGRALRREPFAAGRERILFDVPIDELAGTLRTIAPPAEIEHIYDF